MGNDQSAENIPQLDEPEQSPAALSEDKNVHEFNFSTSYRNSRNQNIAYNYWVPVDRKCKALVFFIHGLHEEGSRYSLIANFLAGRGFACFAHDHIGHGQSDGVKGLIPNFDEVVSDTVEFMRFTANSNEYFEMPVAAMLHSMGTVVGGLALKTLQTADPSIAGRIKAVVMSGALVVPGPDAASPLGIRSLYCLNSCNPIMECLTCFMDRIDPNGPAAPLNRTVLTHDEVLTQQILASDEYGWIKNHTSAEIRKGIKKLDETFKDFHFPVLFLHGTSDTICLPCSSEIWHSRVASEINEIKLYEGMYHEIINEVNNGQVFNDICNFIEARLV